MMQMVIKWMAKEKSIFRFEISVARNIAATSNPTSQLTTFKTIVNLILTTIPGHTQPHPQTPTNSSP